jgi:hypothetical protein
MAGHFGIGWILTQRADKQLGHSGDHPSTVLQRLGGLCPH